MKEQQHNSQSKGSFVGQIRLLAKDWDVKVMSYVMLVIVMVATIAATVAWFFYFDVVAVSNMHMTTASSDSLKVEVKQGEDNGQPNFVELKEGEEDTVFAYIDMPVFHNVETYEITFGDGEASRTKTVNKMAPGVYGSVTIRLTALTKGINHYKLSTKAIFDYVDTLTVEMEDGIPSENQTDFNVQMLQKLSKGHILFFASRQERVKSSEGILPDTVTIDGESHPVTEYTHNKKYIFYEPIERDGYMEGDLTWNDTKNEGIPQVVTVYWYWPYEYTNLSSVIKEGIKLPQNETEISTILNNETSQLYFDKAKMQELVDGTGSYDEIQLYDYADTRIGTYVEKIKIRLEVDGYHAMDTQSQSTE